MARTRSRFDVEDTGPRSDVRVVGRDIEEVARVERVSPASLAPGGLGPPP